MIKKGDTVLVIAGKDLGKKGTVEKTIPSSDRVIIEGINLRKRHFKPSSARPKGGIVEVPGSMHRSNVMVVCPHCSKPTRIAHTVSENGKNRRCTHCNDSLDK